MGLTSQGLPYPEGTDLVRDGDNVIKSLAQAIDAKILATPVALSLRLAANFAAAGTSTWYNFGGWAVEAASAGWTYNLSTGVVTIPMDGYYRVECSIMFSSPTGLRAAAIVVNGAQVTQSNHAADGSSNLSAHTWIEMNLTQGTTVNFQYYIAAASNIITYGAPNNPTRAVIRRLGGMQTTASPAPAPANDTGWLTPTLINGWVNYSNGYTVARYRRINGIVYLHGLVANGTGDVFQLPAGFRTAGGTLIFGVKAGTDTAAGRIDVDSAGNVRYMSGGNGYLTLAGIQFPADA